MSMDINVENENELNLNINQIDLNQEEEEDTDKNEVENENLQNLEEEEEAEILDEKDGIVNEEELISHQRHLSMRVAESEDCDTKQLATYQEQRHVFVLSEAGKPVYALHGNDNKWSPMMGVIVALVACVRARNDHLKHVVAGSHKFVFLVKPHLILVGIYSTAESVQQINIYLEYVYDTLVSILCGGQIAKILSTQQNFDLRRLITDTDVKFFNNLCREMGNAPCYFLQSIECFQVSSEVRDCCGKALQSSFSLDKSDDLVYAVLISAGRVVSTCRLKEHPLHTKDLQVLLNYITSSTSFNNGETWAPICLPHFNLSGFLYAHISYLDESNLQTCLILLSNESGGFDICSKRKKEVLARLTKTNCLLAIESTIKKGFYKVEQLGVPELRHFIYKAKNCSQFTCPQLTSPYTDPKERDRLFENYKKLHGKVHDTNVPLKLLYSVSGQETMLAWIASGFELYAAFGPLITKQQAIQIVEKILRWIKLKEEELFMPKPPVF